MNMAGCTYDVQVIGHFVEMYNIATGDMMENQVAISNDEIQQAVERFQKRAWAFHAEDRLDYFANIGAEDAHINALSYEEVRVMWKGL